MILNFAGSPAVATGLKISVLAIGLCGFVACSSGGGGGGSPAAPNNPNGPSNPGSSSNPQPDGSSPSPTDVSITSVPNRLIFDAKVPSDRQASLNEAISSLYTMPAIDITSSSANQAIAKIMGLSDLNPKTLQSWIETRSHYIINDDFDIEGHLSDSNEAFTYPETDKIPDVVKAELATNGGSDSSQSSTIMLNMGGALYLEGKISNKLKILNLSNGTGVRLTSPRAGIIQIGQGMFSFFNGLPFTPQNIASDFFHAAILFHESRHSDGNGRSLAFLHDVCPTGDYAGQPACDAATNGPYTVGAEMMRALMQSCDTRCTQQTLTILQVLYTDQASRLLTASELPNASPDTQAGQSWDDAPEGTRSN